MKSFKLLEIMAFAFLTVCAVWGSIHIGRLAGESTHCPPVLGDPLQILPETEFVHYVTLTPDGAWEEFRNGKLIGNGRAEDGRLYNWFGTPWRDWYHYCKVCNEWHTNTYGH